MKQLLLTLFVSFFAFSRALATEQFADILIIGNDTIYLKTFPLEYLKVKKTPFYYGNYSFSHTACYRGYVATWQVFNETLVLKEVVKLDSLGTQLNVTEYLKNNGYNPKMLNNYVIANWYSDTLKSYDFFRYNFAYLRENFYVMRDFLKEENKRIELVFEKGKLVKNNIIPIADYKIGDTLSFDVYYFQDWLVWSNYKSVQVKGIITKNNGKKVLLEIFSWGTDKKRIQRKIQKKIAEIIWVNPRYCRR